MSVIDPQTWRDAEDGRALRELVDAIGQQTVSVHRDADGLWQVWVDLWMQPRRVSGYGATVAEAADLAREALR